ncbi:MAG TPA: hemolysin family protein [Anaerolineae bacterium]|nr:hemolysin family protein [Anaerolineae bacterium]
MDEGWIVAWLGLGLALMLIALAAAAEVSLGAISRANIRRLLDEGVSRAQALQTLLDDPPRFILALMILGILSLIMAAIAASWLVVSAGWPWLPGVPLALVGLGVAVLLVQVTARALAMRATEQTALRLSAFVRGTALLLSPLTAPLMALAGAILGRTEEDTSPDNVLLSEEGLRYLINAAEEPGLIEEDEKKMIASIFELGEMVAREVMAPRIDVVAMEETTTLRAALDVIIQAGHSRIPVYRDSIDTVQGVLYAKDLLLPLRDGRYDAPVTELMRPAYFVPESKRVDDLLQELQQRRVHMAIVVDEYGGTAGVVTIEDLLEEIVGDIQDEYDSEAPMAQQVGEREYIFDAQIRLDEVNDILDVSLPSEESDTLGGFIYRQLGVMPAVGSRVNYEQLALEVQTVQGRRILQVRVAKTLENAPAASEPTAKPALSASPAS